VIDDAVMVNSKISKNWLENWPKISEHWQNKLVHEKKSSLPISVYYFRFCQFGRLADLDWQIYL
jgi:hypothetical protein